MNKAWPRGADGSKAAANDPSFAEVVSDFSRQLEERAAQHAAPDRMAAERERRAALRAHDRAHRHRQILIGGFCIGALMGLALAMIAPPVAPPHLTTAGTAAGGPAPAMASAAPPSAPLAPTSPPAPASPAVAPPPPLAATAPVDTPPPTELAPTEPAKTEQATASAPPAAEEPSPPVTLLRAEEVREVQNKLRGFGFNPGPSDGVPGRLTLAAAAQYQQRRGLPQTGEVDRDLLDQLRQDPAPQVAQRPARAVRAGTVTARRDPDPLQRLGQWLDSLVR